MTNGHRTFDTDKAVEAIVYTVDKAHRDLYATLKLIYLADRCHLERYGRFMFGDWYVAMDSGPVPSGAYDIIRDVRAHADTTGSRRASSAFTVELYAIKTLRRPEMDELSQSDVECLDMAIAKYGHLTGPQLKKLTHDIAYDRAPLNGEIKPIEIARALGNSTLVEHLSDPHPDRN
jgi:uncharacterized phage-associated protein